MTITKLDTETVERIAAGEVIARPASAVKELVENSLDAGAERVRVTVEDGGFGAVRVADDGRGMTEADALLAVERHATSKIASADDVERVATLGFRGEALPSVARVGRLELTTKAAGGAGVRLAVDGDEKTTVEAGRGVGTTVEVRDLFGSMPARREALGTPTAEFARVSDVVAGYALARPDVRFELDHDGHRVFATSGSGAFTDAALGVYDRTVAGRSVAFEADGEGEVRVAGLAAHPSVTRARPNHVVTAVNGRVVRDGALRRAVAAGYGSLLPGDRYPVAVANVTLPPGAVDVNVHPAKAEVAFRDEDAVTAAVEGAIRDALSTEDLRRSADVAFDLDSSLAPVETDSLFDELTVIGRFRELYLLCEADDELLIVDGHAAHERINYERLRASVGEVESAAVDPPETLSLGAAEASALEAHREELAALGFELSPFGGGTYRVSRVPAPLGRAADPSAVADILDALRDGGRPERVRDELLADLACHPSLKAGDPLADADAARLVRRLGACEQPFACPHGRPTVLSLDEGTLAKGFERDGARR